MSIIDISGKRISSKTFTQSQVNELVKKAREEGYTDGVAKGFADGQNHSEMREKLNRLNDGLPEVEIESPDMVGHIEHVFCGGIFFRSAIIKEGARIQKHVHDYDHASFLVAGEVDLEVEGTEPIANDEPFYLKTRVKAPELITIAKGLKHSVTAVNGPAKWVCIHKTDVDDMGSVGEVILEKTA